MSFYAGNLKVFPFICEHGPCWEEEERNSSSLTTRNGLVFEWAGMEFKGE